jgi:hypothetical protein
MDTVDQVMFSWTQSEVEAAVLFCKVWQAVKIVDRFIRETALFWGLLSGAVKNITNIGGLSRYQQASVAAAVGGDAVRTL